MQQKEFTFDDVCELVSEHILKPFGDMRASHISLSYQNGLLVLYTDVSGLVVLRPGQKITVDEAGSIFMN